MREHSLRILIVHSPHSLTPLLPYSLTPSAFPQNRRVTLNFAVSSGALVIRVFAANVGSAPR